MNGLDSQSSWAPIKLKSDYPTKIDKLDDLIPQSVETVEKNSENLSKHSSQSKETKKKRETNYNSDIECLGTDPNND